jgi:hypothetical protein
MLQNICTSQKVINKEEKTEINEGNKTMKSNNKELDGGETKFQRSTVWK